MVLCSSILNLSKSSKLLHPHSQVLAFEASEASSQLAKLEVFWRTALGNLWYLGPLLSTGRLKWTRDAHPRGVLGLVKGWQGLFSLEGACPNGHWDSAELGYRGPGLASRLWKPREPFPVWTGPLHREPSCACSSIVFRSAFKNIYIYFISVLDFRLYFLFLPTPTHAFFSCTHTCMSIFI